ncbi:metallo-beta-lactamase superfamily protein [Chitinophaga skermanii]|uniref:Metallo-beta-lactamase superfamily protein n=1 Tax=Chitinophaga skermanii TaxID=331697 RepID=A0A327QNK8_9BACT|nr:MBL fold metallo-hydrolase [Chitinophaga skermanii]RAJ05475.1 metallo-beta-lactamase superfamily protein [Chitinophaga skermanii]
MKYIVTLVACCIYSITLVAQSLEIHQMNVGQGDGALIIVRDVVKLKAIIEKYAKKTKIPDNPAEYIRYAMSNNLDVKNTIKFAVLIDAGAGKAQADKIKKYMAKVGVKRVTHSILSHFHGDHYGGLQYLFTQANNFPEIAAYDRGLNGEGPTISKTAEHTVYNRFENTMKKKHKTATLETNIALGDKINMQCIVADGETFDGIMKIKDEDDALIDFTSSDENDYSLGWILQYGAFRFYTNGDLRGLPSEFHLETTLADALRNHDKSKFVSVADGNALEGGHVCSFKVSHHGSAESTNDYFLTVIKPSTAIVSSGIQKKFLHPRIEVVEVLDAATKYKWNIQEWKDPEMKKDRSKFQYTNTIKNVFYTSMMNADLYETSGKYTDKQIQFIQNTSNEKKSNGIVGGDIVLVVEDKNIDTESNYIVFWNGEKGDDVLISSEQIKSLQGKKAKQPDAQNPKKAGLIRYQCHTATQVKHYKYTK